MMKSLSGVGVIDKSVAILAALGEGRALGLAELAAATGLPRPTAYRLAVALAAHGLLGRDPAGRFQLGARLAAWGRAAPQAGALAEVATGVLERLCADTRESAQLYVRDGDRRVCIAAVERASGLRDGVPVGARLAMDAGSGAKVLAAWAEPPGAGGFPARELAAVRRRGWADSLAEREPGVASVSAPVHGPDGTVIAALCCSGPLDRIRARRAELARRVREAAAEVSARLGAAGAAERAGTDRRGVDR